MIKSPLKFLFYLNKKYHYKASHSKQMNTTVAYLTEAEN